MQGDISYRNFLNPANARSRDANERLRLISSEREGPVSVAVHVTLLRSLPMTTTGATVFLCVMDPKMVSPPLGRR